MRFRILMSRRVQNDLHLWRNLKRTCIIANFVNLQTFKPGTLSHAWHPKPFSESSFSKGPRLCDSHHCVLSTQDPCEILAPKPESRHKQQTRPYQKQKPLSQNAQHPHKCSKGLPPPSFSRPASPSQRGCSRNTSPIRRAFGAL